MNKPPEVIYLQWGDDEGIEYFDDDDFVTWCVDQINDTDVAYINIADVLDCQFDMVHDAGIKLRQIIERDLEGMYGSPLERGAEDYIVRVVIEALFHKMIARENNENTDV